MKKSIKKGFTLVELLVVIAIIAILSIVGIVGYVSFTNRARISNDTTIVTELNRVLQAEHVNKKPSTMQDVVDEIFDAGFDLTKLTPTAAKHHIVYDMSENVDRFYLLDENEKIVGGEHNGESLQTEPEKLWKVVQKYSDATDGKYSYYLGKMKDDESEPGDGLTVRSGIDVGSNSVSKINYVGNGSTAQEVVIRTNSAATTLTINAPLDTIHHYDTVGSVDIIAVANKSYHENGNVAFLEIAKGRVSLESESNVKQIHVSTKVTDVAEDGTKTKQANTFDQIIVALASGVQAPDFSRDEVALDSIGENGTLVVEIEKDDNQSDYVYLHQQGLVEQIKVTTGASTNSNDNVQAAAIDSSAKTGNDDTLSRNTSSIANDIANNLKAGSTATPEQIASGTVDLSEIEDAGLSEETKADAMAEVIDELAGEEVEASNQNGANYVARIGAEGYETLKEAVGAAQPGQTIKVIASSIIIDSDIGAYASYQYSGINSIVSFEADTSIYFQNNARVYMTDNATFELNGNKLYVSFEASCDGSVDCGFMNCDICNMYSGLHQEYWDYKFEDDRARIMVDFHGNENTAPGFGLVYTNNEYVVGGMSSDNNCAYDEECANYVYIDGVEQPGGGQWSQVVMIGNVARFYLGAETATYSWKIYGDGNHTKDVETSKYLKIEENHNNWVVVKGLVNEHGMNGSPAILEVTITYSNSSTKTYEWWIDVRGGNSGTPGLPPSMDDIEW